MNITPWVQSRIRNNVEQEWISWFNCQENGYGVKVKSSEWIGYRDLHLLSVSEFGIAIETGRSLGGERRNEYAWDEMSGWNYERGAGGYYFN